MPDRASPLRRLSAPVDAFLNLTNACNLRCLYCSADSGRPGPDELTRGEWERVIDELADLRVFTVTVTGGEALVRRDAFHLLERLVHHRIDVRLISNGTLLRPATVARLVDLGIHSVKVSLDGASAAVNDTTRGAGSFDRAVAGVRNLLAAGVRPVVLVTVTRRNLLRIAETAAALADLGVRAVAFNMVAELGRETCQEAVLGLRPEDLRELAVRLRDAQDAHPDLVKEDLLHWLRLPSRLPGNGFEQNGHPVPGARMLPCGAARTSCAVTADGWVVPCNKLAGWRCGNVRTETLAEIWRGPAMERVRGLAEVATSSAPGCAACRYRTVCAGGCRAEAYLRFGDLLAPDPRCAVLADSAVHEALGGGHSRQAPRRHALSPSVHEESALGSKTPRTS